MNIWLPEQVRLAVSVLGLPHPANTVIMRDRIISQHCCWKFRCVGAWSSVFGSTVHDVSKGCSAFETSDWLALKMKVLQSFETPITASSILHYHLRKPESLFLLCMAKRRTFNFDTWRTSNLSNRTKLNIFKFLHFQEQKLDQNERELDNLPSY